MSFQLGLADGYGGMGVPRIGSEATLDAPLELCSAGLELEAELRGLEELCPQTDSPPPSPRIPLALALQVTCHQCPPSPPRKALRKEAESSALSGQDLASSLCDFGQVTQLL